MTLSVFVPVGALTILLGLLYVAVLLDLVRLWWTDPNYSHGFLVPVIASYLVWNRRLRLSRVQVQPSAWGILVLLVGLCFLLAGQGVTIAGGGRGALFLKGLSLVLTCGGMVLLCAGKSFLKILAFPLIYLGFMMPLPDGLFTLITLPLQSYATSVTTSALQLFDIPILRQGNLIHLPSFTLGITEACSGIRSLITLLAGTIALSYLALNHWWQHLILVGSVIPITIVTNAFRVTGTGLLAYFLGDQVAQSFFHGFSGWVILMMASVLLCTEALLLVRLPADVGQEAAS